MSNVPAPEVAVPSVKIPKGLATKVGYFLGLAQLIIAALVPLVADLPENPELSGLIAALVLGANAVVKGVNDGRQKQAAAIYQDLPSPAQLDDFSGENDLDEFNEPTTGALGFDPDRPVH